jgi:hypothetical protein
LQGKEISSGTKGGKIRRKRRKRAYLRKQILFFYKHSRPQKFRKKGQQEYTGGETQGIDLLIDQRRNTQKSA